ncbi:hypothetical protein BCL76_102424 [Streptomyces sp. CG 926]|uniref:hypothetical protein n=1 Tax=unclassified Streptomyces TaxID=2593676 RepID=UPI000D6B1C62|nr:hypothetical protein [Streptomyces sp. CG 926]PWK73399.1 hypothetical protein BCL76_102424 [Streptomyces sp. CG 926]
MRTRVLRFGLYADEPGLAWVRGLVADAVGSRSARIMEMSVLRTLPGSGMPAAEMYEHLVDQWDIEHPGEGRGGREPVELRVDLDCSLRTWRAVRAAVIEGLCPEGAGRHVCRVPWATR